MEKFSKTEIAWVTAAIVSEASRLSGLSKEGGICASLARLRSEQLEGLANRFARALEKGDKRIDISR